MLNIHTYQLVNNFFLIEIMIFSPEILRAIIEFIQDLRERDRISKILNVGILYNTVNAGEANINYSHKSLKLWENITPGLNLNFVTKLFIEKNHTYNLSFFTHLIYLEMSDNFNTEIDLPPWLKELTMGLNFNKKINLKNLVKLTMGKHFDVTIIIPDSLKHLKMGSYFNRDIDLNKITYLSVGNSFDKPLHITKTLTHLYFPFLSQFNGQIDTQNLEHLKLNDNLNENVNLIFNFSNLKSLKVCNFYERFQISNLIEELEINFLHCNLNLKDKRNLKKLFINNFRSELPKNLEKLSIISYDKPLPSSLKYLTIVKHDFKLPDSLISLNIDYLTDEFELPKSLKTLSIRYPYKIAKFPNSLTKLTVYYFFDKEIELPNSITHLHMLSYIPNEIPYKIDIPNSVTHLTLGMQPCNIPDSVIFLDAGHYYSEAQLPPNLNELIIRSNKVHFEIPKTLTKISLPRSYNFDLKLDKNVIVEYL
jgi:hypothetical protein